MSEKGKIDITGARTNNLRAVDIEFSLSQATMVVGVSGSGKSSLLADTLASEANSRMRRFLGVHQPHLSNEDVPAFVGPLPASVHFSQGAFRASRRTTVSTSSGILALLRLYFRRYARPWAEEVKKEVPPPTPENYKSWVERHYTGPLSVWIVVARWERTDGTRAADRLRRHGLKRATVRSETDAGSRREYGREVDLERFRPLAESVRHLIEAEVGRIHVGGADHELRSLLQRAFDIAGDVIVEFHEGKDLPEELHDQRGVLLDSTEHWVHPLVRRPFAPPSDALLSFNSPSNPRSGACRACHGLGRVRTVAIAALVTHPERSLHNGALSLWTEKNYRYVNIQHETIEGLRGLHGFTPDKAWNRLGEDARRLILFGSEGELIADVDRKTKRKVSAPRPFPGFVPEILRRAEGAGAAARALGAIASEAPCTECNGTRWSRAAQALRLGHWSIAELLGFPFEQLEQVAAPGGQLERGLPEAARPLANGLQSAASAFVSAGLGHLSGERGMTTLSEGESRRSRLAALLCARGEGLALLLDEPARGLHEEDVTRLAAALADLKHRHTLIINEHRLSLARIADRVVEIGPGAGAEGGRIVKSGPPQDVLALKPSSQPGRAPISTTTRGPWLIVEGAQLHTLSNVSCKIPLGRLVCITGVSGSGKSTFIRGILVPALAQSLPGQVDCDGFVWPDGRWERVEGLADIRSVLALEPRAPGAQRRSTVATLLGLAEDLRRIFGKSAEARNAGLTATDFGWNAGRGRCQTCLGLGEVEDDGGWVPCPHCGGRRFGEEVLGIRVDGLNVADLLDRPISDLVHHPITDIAGWGPLIDQLLAVDLGYLTLGRRIDRVSGGEHQRLRIARTLCTNHPKGLFLVLDEPSAGLHPQDVSQLLKVLDRLVGKGLNTVLLVEHNLDLIRASDWVIDFGPGGGPNGGRIVGAASPGRIAGRDTPTGRVLANRHLTTRLGRHTTRRRLSKSRAADSQVVAHSGRQWLKRLFGEEVSAEDLDPVDFEGLAVAFDAAAAMARPYEIGGLDIEIARLLLDEADDTSEQPKRMASIWSESPKAQLRIHPLIDELRVWGDTLPLSVVRAAQQRLKSMGLESTSIAVRRDLGAVRATGKRFQPATQTSSHRLDCVRDALGIGGGYVELWEDGAGVLLTVQKRHLDLEIPAVAPVCASSATLSRSHAAGRCPCCSGSGCVSSCDQSLIIARPKADPASEDFFRPEALDVLRSVRRTILLPFLKRMAAEGLWPSARPFSKLDSNEVTILMHGFWCRPGPGTFLKTPRADPEDVKSWLRWNGLFRTVFEESGRSNANEWVSQLEATTHQAECPRCAGTGLEIHTRAIRLGSRSLFDWVREGTVDAFLNALAQFNPPSSRSKKMQARVLSCFDPLKRAVPHALLREPIADPKLLRDVFERVVRSLTRLDVIG